VTAGLTRLETLELVIQPGRESLDAAAAPGRGTRAAVVNEYRVSPVVTIRREPSAAGAQVIVRIAVIDGQGGVEVPGQLLVELCRHAIVYISAVLRGASGL